MTLLPPAQNGFSWGTKKLTKVVHWICTECEPHQSVPSQTQGEIRDWEVRAGLHFSWGLNFSTRHVLVSISSWSEEWDIYEFTQEKAKKAVPFLVCTTGVMFLQPPLCCVICEKTHLLPDITESNLRGTAWGAEFSGWHLGLG